MDRRRAPSTVLSVALCATFALAGCTAGDDDEPAPTAPPGAPMTAPAGGLPEVVARVEPSVVTVFAGEGLGSGVVFRAGGLVLTNEHVVRGSTSAELALADGTRVPARIVGADRLTDLAVLKVDRDLPAAPLRTDLPRPGETVLAMGSPLGFRNSVTMGIVSGIGREIPGSAAQTRSLVDLIQTDAAISPGNSGGALVDTAGRVVGINEAYIPPQAGAVSLGFAIPAATAVDVADDLLDDGKATHPYIGIAPARLTPQIAEALGAPTHLGALVREVVPDSPAAAAGLRPGDIITEFTGQRVETLENLLGALRGVEPGQTADLTYRRGEDSRTATLTVGALRQR